MAESSTLREEVAKLHANVCNGIANMTRIMIIYTLADGQKNVSELANALELPQPTVSRHLKIMRDCGIVLTERAGQAVVYKLKDVRIVQALDLLRSVMTDTLEDRAALAREGSGALIR